MTTHHKQIDLALLYRVFWHYFNRVLASIRYNTTQTSPSLVFLEFYELKILKLKAGESKDYGEAEMRLFLGSWCLIEAEAKVSWALED